jgi:mRNA interferase RelE/StbE
VEVRFEAAFGKDLRKIRDPKLLGRIREVIEDVKEADDIREIRNCKKLKGHDSYFRIRIPDYRIGLDISGNVAIFVRILHRKDVYRFFPPG